MLAIFSHFNEVLGLFHQLWPSKEINENSMKQVFDNGLRSKNDVFYCAEINGKVVGFCSYAIMNSFWQGGKIAYIYSMIVEEKLRGNGIGRKLIYEVCNDAKVYGCKKMELDSGFQRERAHKFYETIGFSKRAYKFSSDL